MLFQPLTPTVMIESSAICKANNISPASRSYIIYLPKPALTQLLGRIELFKLDFASLLGRRDDETQSDSRAVAASLGKPVESQPPNKSERPNVAEVRPD